ncbi:hypothetical protein GDO78_022933 [Eleutherodactylus coqui]|uniref:Integrase catalytic domain-containing protein n=1 Tax=Eleutherodactylus coqui TaxID=57060 RepID=A0A8J6B2F9_ELECQ|nr:hypothetical protein GDO78_022933 [Eleutherodactylus coqui]
MVSSVPFVRLVEKKNDQKATLHPIISTRPLELLLAIDHLQIETSKTGFNYILTLIDYYTKFTVAVPVEDLTAKPTASIVWSTLS